MSRNLESRIERLEKYNANSKIFVTYYFSPEETREDAEARFERTHGFKMSDSDNAIVINFCPA